MSKHPACSIDGHDFFFTFIPKTFNFIYYLLDPNKDTRATEILQNLYLLPNTSSACLLWLFAKICKF